MAALSGSLRYELLAMVIAIGLLLWCASRAWQARLLSWGTQRSPSAIRRMRSHPGSFVTGALIVACVGSGHIGYELALGHPLTAIPGDAAYFVHPITFSDDQDELDASRICLVLMVPDSKDREPRIRDVRLGTITSTICREAVFAGPPIRVLVSDARSFPIVTR